MREGWHGVSKEEALGGALDVGLNWDPRGRRIRSDKRPDKDWRRVRDRVLRPVIRTVAGTHPVAFVISRLLKI